jgi:hypothetical protein
MMAYYPDGDKIHKEVAISAGATRDEMIEAAAIVGLVRLGSALPLLR